MKLLALLLLSACCQIFAQSQPNLNTGKITGRCVDPTTKEPVEYASVAVFTQGSNTAVNGTISNNNGDFVIDKLPYGEYTIKINFIGFKDAAIEHLLLSKEKPTVNLNAIFLSPSAMLLESVEITSKTTAVKNKIDKLVYNPENDLAAQGGTAIDVLKKVPTVAVTNIHIQLLIFRTLKYRVLACFRRFLRLHIK